MCGIAHPPHIRGLGLCMHWGLRRLPLQEINHLLHVHPLTRNSHRQGLLHQGLPPNMTHLRVETGRDLRERGTQVTKPNSGSMRVPWPFPAPVGVQVQ